MRGKSLEHPAGRGQQIVTVTVDEVPEPAGRSPFAAWLMAVIMPLKFHTAQMVFGVRALVSYCSQAFTLEPGVLIATVHTPSGVGTFRKPPFYTVNRKWRRGGDRSGRVWAGMENVVRL